MDNMERMPGSQFDSMDFAALESDPATGPTLQEQALNYLRTKDSEFFNKEFSGELDSEGYLLKKDGTTSNLKPSQNIGGGAAMQRVEELTRAALQQ
ncbi:MAG: hypothetical protein JWN50_822 [Parcubacteria group bacterium]|nr:hypothetical protein [Parcubacteria group bacterium]